MILTALILVGALSQFEPADVFNWPYSVGTEKRYEAYVLCFAKGSFDRRQRAGPPEAHMLEAKAACRREYDAFVAGAVEESQRSSDATLAAGKARSFLDAMDARAIIGPPAPANLAQLPVEGFVGDWRMGNGPLAVDMNVRFADDGSLVGVLKPDFEPSADGLRIWKITSERNKKAVFHASFSDGRVVEYNLIPSSPGEMNFINAKEPTIQRFDLLIDDHGIILRLVTPNAGTQLRFSRHIVTVQEPK